jgi:hypothetical protein
VRGLQRIAQPLPHELAHRVALGRIVQGDARDVKVTLHEDVGTIAHCCLTW